jgi:hypothetical protein
MPVPGMNLIEGAYIKRGRCGGFFPVYKKMAMDPRVIH